MLGVSIFAAFIYFAALGYIVYSTTTSLTRSAYSSTSSVLNFLENLLDLLSSVAANPFSFFFAVVMNFVLLYGLFTLNIFSLYLIDIARLIE